MPNGNHELRDMLGFPFTKDRYASYARGVIGEPNHFASEGRYSGWFEKSLRYWDQTCVNRVLGFGFERLEDQPHRARRIRLETSTHV